MSERGVVWEETIILLPDNVHYVFLSATIPNASQFAMWIAHLHKQVRLVCQCLSLCSTLSFPLTLLTSFVAPILTPFQLLALHPISSLLHFLPQLFFLIFGHPSPHNPLFPSLPLFPEQPPFSPLNYLFPFLTPLSLLNPLFLFSAPFPLSTPFFSLNLFSPLSSPFFSLNSPFFSQPLFSTLYL